MGLKEKLLAREATLGVIGLGYVGLPLAVEKAKAGFKVYGFDVQKEKVDMVNAGKNYIGDVVNEDLEALVKAGMKPVELQPKEGLALNNGTTVMNAVAALCIVDALTMQKNADIAASMSAEALHAVPYAFDKRTHDLRPQVGQGIVAENMRRLLEGSEIVEAYKKDRVQDAYSLRCLPQVHGASRDAIAYVKEKIEIEINSVTDNPIIFHKDGDAVSGGNFHGQPLAISYDFLGIALAELGNISERRIAQLIMGLRGLPEFLVANPGLNSGFMIPQYAAASMVSQNKMYCYAASSDSIVSSNGQEDHVSMGANAATKLYRIMDNLEHILSIELMNAAQGIDFRRPQKTSPVLERFLHEYRKEVPFVKDDIVMYKEIHKTVAFLSRTKFDY